MQRQTWVRLVVARVLLAGAIPLFVSCPALATLPISTALVASGLDLPLYVTAPPGDTSRLFIVDQGTDGSAQIRVLDLSTHTLLPTPFLTISGIATGGEQGLLGMAFDPNYATNSRFYVDYTATGGSFGNGVTHIRQYSVSSNPDVANPASAVDILTIDKPQTNHNGGWIGFSNRPGDSGNLYIAMGDGGAENDAGSGHNPTIGNAQDTNSLLGKILRITPDVGAGPAAHPNYTIPANNPFVSGGGAPEVWLYGLRNPWRDSFDRATGNFFIGDVGQDTREEVDFQSAANPGGGENYGWRVREGRIQNPAYPGVPTPPGAIDPIYDYTHDNPSVGQVEIGGYVYRGNLNPSLRGMYVFADAAGPKGPSGTPQIFAIPGDGSSTATDQAINLTSELDPPGSHFFSISSFGEDAAGELYLTDLSTGNVYEIVPSAVTVPAPAAPMAIVALLLFASPLMLRRRVCAARRHNPIFGGC